MEKMALITRLQTQLQALEVILQAPKEALEARPIPGKWSARENLAHIGRFQEVTAERLETIPSQDNPTLASRTPENDPGSAAWMELSLEEVIQRTVAFRPILISKVAQLPEAALSQPLAHPAYGPLTLGGLIELFLIHEGHHLFVAMQRSRGH